MVGGMRMSWCPEPLLQEFFFRECFASRMHGELIVGIKPIEGLVSEIGPLAHLIPIGFLSHSWRRGSRDGLLKLGSDTIKRNFLRGRAAEVIVKHNGSTGTGRHHDRYFGILGPGYNGGRRIGVNGNRRRGRHTAR